MTELRAEEIIRLLDLKPHPEGGFFRETFRDDRKADGRAASTAIYYLLGLGDVSEWHRVDAAEVWHFYAGAPLVITVSPNGHDASAHHLGPNLARGHRPQFVVPVGWWQTATSLGAWTLVGCTVAPGFDFAGFELAPPGWRPSPRPRGDPDLSPLTVQAVTVRFLGQVATSAPTAIRTQASASEKVGSA